MAASQKIGPETQIFDLDNSAIIYAATNKKNWNRVFRVASVLKEDIQPELVSRAIADLRPRFPSFFVQLKEGFLKYSLRTVDDTDVLVKESDYPCRPVVAGRGEKPMFRVVYNKNRLSLEIFHVITDGTGAICFLKNIVARYLELQGIDIEKTDGVLNLEEGPCESETEDSFMKLDCTEAKKVSRSEAKAYKYLPDIKPGIFKLVHGLISVDEIKAITKAKDVTVTEYFTAVYAWAIYQNMLPDKSDKPIKISVPTDLRRLFGSNTLRNFALFVNVCIHSEQAKLTFDEILAETKRQLREGLKKEKLLNAACKNVSDSNMPVFKLMPLVLKKYLLRAGFVLLGERLVTTCLSNIGIITVPKGMEPYIDRFDFVLGGTPKNYINCGVASFNGIINITFSSKSELTDIQKRFFKFLSEQGVTVSIETNE